MQATPSVTVGRIYVRTGSTAMRPNTNNNNNNNHHHHHHHHHRQQQQQQQQSALKHKN